MAKYPTKFQIFVSSTFTDLKEERRLILEAILELDHIPCGMEAFPANSNTPFDVIKKMIDQSDFYILVIGARYGSTNEEGISYTEMEYNYALEKRKHILCFIHSNPQSIPVENADIKPNLVKKLKRFKDKASKHLIKHWDDKHRLQSYVSSSLAWAFNNNPMQGWIRIPSIEEYDNEQKAKIENVVSEKINVERQNLRSEYDEFYQNKLLKEKSEIDIRLKLHYDKLLADEKELINQMKNDEISLLRRNLEREYEVKIDKFINEFRKENGSGSRDFGKRIFDSFIRLKSLYSKNVLKKFLRPTVVLIIILAIYLIFPKGQSVDKSKKDQFQIDSLHTFKQFFIRADSLFSIDSFAESKVYYEKSLVFCPDSARRSEIELQILHAAIAIGVIDLSGIDRAIDFCKESINREFSQKIITLIDSSLTKKFPYGKTVLYDNRRPFNGLIAKINNGRKVGFINWTGKQITEDNKRWNNGDYINDVKGLAVLSSIPNPKIRNSTNNSAVLVDTSGPITTKYHMISTHLDKSGNIVASRNGKKILLGLDGKLKK